MSVIDLLNKIREAGVVGAGGGGFPAFKKLTSKVDHIIANGVECEPLLYKDREVMLQETEKMISGLLIVRELTGASKATLAIKRKNEDILNKISSVAKKEKIDIHISENVYPAGDEFILVYEVTGKRIPPGGIPLMVGCVVNNVETLVNISNAVENIPVTEKYLTIAGAVKNPVTAAVPVGISFGECISLAGGASIPDPVILTGGVMMGGVESDLSLPVNKTLGGLVVLPSDHSLVIRKSASAKSYNKAGHSTCDQCTFCTQLCPRYILGYPIQPHLVMRSLQMTGETKDRLNQWAEHCCECNICTLFACPEKLDPKSICVDSKIRLKEENKGFTKKDLDEVFREIHPARDGREIPITSLYQRLGIKKYDRKAEFISYEKKLSKVLIPLKYGFGNNPDPVVSEGMKVKKGDLLASSGENGISVPVHSSINGIVKDVSHNGILITAN